MICNFQSLPDCWTVNRFSNDYNMVNPSDGDHKACEKFQSCSTFHIASSVFSCIFLITFTKFTVEMSILWGILMLFGHQNYAGTPSAATQFWAVFFPFIGLDFKPKCYDLVFSMVNTIRADVLTTLIHNCSHQLMTAVSWVSSLSEVAKMLVGGAVGSCQGWRERAFTYTIEGMCMDDPR